MYESTPFSLLNSNVLHLGKYSNSTMSFIFNHLHDGLKSCCLCISTLKTPQVLLCIVISDRFGKETKLHAFLVQVLKLIADKGVMREPSRLSPTKLKKMVTVWKQDRSDALADVDDVIPSFASETLSEPKEEELVDHRCALPCVFPPFENPAAEYTFYHVGKILVHCESVYAKELVGGFAT